MENYLPDQFDSILESNFDISTSENFMVEIENELDNNFIDNLIFDDGGDAKIYNMLDEDASKRILDAVITKEATENAKFIQCTNCDHVFTNEAFALHVCKYDENQELIESQIDDDPNENSLQKVRRHLTTLFDRNARMLQKILHGYPKSTAGQSSKDEKAKQSNFDCFVCSRKFVHESGLYRHMDKHIGEMLKESKLSDALHTVTLCVFCGEVFTMEQKAWIHLKANHLKVDGDTIWLNYHHCGLQLNAVEAKDDSEKISMFEKLGLHEKSSTDDPTTVIHVPKPDVPVRDFVRVISIKKLYHCEFCDSLFANEKALLFHISNHEPSSFFSCQTCDLKRLSFKDVLIHRHDECWNYLDYRDSLKTIPCVWKCNVCEDEFLSAEKLLLHRHNSFHFFPRMDFRTNQLLIACEICAITFEGATSFVGHLQDTHLKRAKVPIEPETSSRIQKPSKCMRKGGAFQTSSRPREYLCEICGKSYTQSSHLWQHLRFHQGVKPFVCPHEDCGRRFTIRPDLNDHIRKCHTGERPFLCTICGKRFLTGSVYYQHRLIHRGERRYGCDECGKRFYRTDALKNHQRIHSGERPYKCWINGCGKCFRQKGDIYKHVKARHKDTEEVVDPQPKRQKVTSFGRGRSKNNANLYNATPIEEALPI